MSCVLGARILLSLKNQSFMNKNLLRSLRSALVVMLAVTSVSICVQAQSTVVTGKILDGDTENPLIGTTIMVEGTTTGSVADASGAFSIGVDALPVKLVFSFIGYDSQIISVADASPLTVRMAMDAELVDEVVVVGYGRQKKKVSTGSISKIDSKDIEGIAVPDVISALEGQTSGLLINESSGQPGAGKSILIRGISTNGDNTPLFVVDGLQVGNIDNINPSDIESVDVLKDAASSAIYGARAANGVVIITTKSGTGKDAGSITYSTSYLNSRPWKLPEMLGAEDYVMLMREKFANSNQTAALNALGFPNLGDALSNDTDWMNEIFNPAQVINHRITASGKNSYLSIDYWNQNGVIGGEKSNYKRYALRYNSTEEGQRYLHGWTKSVPQ
jgi:TonB-dependent SusC/RagA subfamily outer membrane receptor